MSAAEFQVKMNRWDNGLTDYMRSAESKCHKFKQNHIEWSPEVGVWIRRKHIMERIIKFLKGRIPDPPNLFRVCATKGITDPRTWTVDIAKAELFICIKKLQELKLKAPKMRHKHLQHCLDMARARDDEKAAADILRIMHQEYNSKR